MSEVVVSVLLVLTTATSAFAQVPAPAQAARGVSVAFGAGQAWTRGSLAMKGPAFGGDVRVDLKHWWVLQLGLVRQVHGVKPFSSDDADSGRVWWTEVGVHQNLTFPVQPDPVSGMHCWHQRVRVEKAGPDDNYGDIDVDTAASHRLYQEWMAKTRPAPGPDGTRRPAWFDRPLRPVPAAYRL